MWEELKTPLLAFCNVHKVRGSILLAEEGINATIVGNPEGINNVWDYLMRDPRLADMTYKESFTDDMPFEKMKVKKAVKAKALYAPIWPMKVHKVFFWYI